MTSTTPAAAPVSQPLVLPSRWWAELSTRDFAALQASGQASQVVAVLPVAAVEQHGPHLPLSVDAALLQGVVEAALTQMPAELPALFLPPQNVGLSTEHLAYPGTLTLSPATLIALWTELGECVARAGLKKLLLFNGHGGNVAVMDIVARELRQRCGLMVYSASWFSLPLPDDVAGQFSAKLGWAMQDYHPDGAVGNAAAATPDKGRAVVQAAAEALVQLLGEIHALPLDTLQEI